MLELRHADEEMMEFEQVYPRSLGYFMAFVAVSFVIWDVVMGIHAPKDVSRWGLWGLFVPMTVALAVVAAHLLYFRRTLRLVPSERTYHITTRSLGRNRHEVGQLEELRHVIVVPAVGDTAQGWLAWRESGRPMVHLAARHTEDPRTRLSAEFCEWLRVPPSHRE